MKTHLLRRGFARVVMCVVIALSFLLGGGRALNDERQLAMQLYSNGAYGAEQGIPHDITKLSSHAINMAAVAGRYMDENDTALRAVRDAVISLTDARGPAEQHRAADALCEAAAALRDAMGRYALSSDDERYRESLWDDIESARHRLERNPYNEAASSYNNTLNAFPGFIYRAALFITPLELY